MLCKTFTAAVIAASLFATYAQAGAARVGSFYGVSGKTTTGSVTVSKDQSGYVVTLGNDFFFSGAPDPKIAFGSNGQYIPGTIIRLIDSNSGAQSFRVPAHIDVSQFNEVHLWCEKFNVGLGIAPIN